jgi:hypothetical protein
MATPTTLPSSFTDGTALPAASLNNLRGAFRVLQVVAGSTTTVTTTTSATYVDTTLTATITPQSNTSKILVLVTQTFLPDVAATDQSIQVLRGATSIGVTTGVGYSSASLVVANFATNVLDSPATTSATTYKTQFKRNSGTGTLYANLNSNPANIILLEISA